jgi:hypothetical protein
MRRSERTIDVAVLELSVSPVSLSTRAGAGSFVHLGITEDITPPHTHLDDIAAADFDQRWHNFLADATHEESRISGTIGFVFAF